MKTTVDAIWSNAPTWGSQISEIKAMQGEVARLGAEWTKTTAPIFGADQAAQKALQTFLDSQAKRAAAMTADAATVGKSTAEQAKMRIEAEAWAIVAAKNITITAAVAKSITDAGNAAAAAAMKLQGAQLIEQTLMPWEQRALQIQQYSTAMIAAGASSDQLAIMQAKIQFPSFTAATTAAIDFGMQMDHLATGAVNGLADALTSIATGTKTAAQAFADFAKKIIADITAMIIKLLIFKALKTALGIPFADGGPVGGTGLSLTATGGQYATGGAVWGAGTATSDSIPAFLSAGEFVMNAAAVKQIGLPMLNALNSGNLPTVPMDKAAGSAMSPAASAPKVIELRGLGSQKIFSRDTVIEILEGLNDALSDGHRIKFA